MWNVGGDGGTRNKGRGAARLQTINVEVGERCHEVISGELQEHRTIVGEGDKVMAPMTDTKVSR